MKLFFFWKYFETIFLELFFETILEMPKVVHNVQFTMTNVQSVLLIGQSVVEFIEVFRSMTNCRICRRIVVEHWPNANEKRGSKEFSTDQLPNYREPSAGKHTDY